MKTLFIVLVTICLTFGLEISDQCEHDIELYQRYQFQDNTFEIDTWQFKSKYIHVMLSTRYGQ